MHTLPHAVLHECLQMRVVISYMFLRLPCRTYLLATTGNFITTYTYKILPEVNKLTAKDYVLKKRKN